MSITSQIQGDTVTITVTGRFDFSCHKEFRDAYRNAPAGSGKKFEIDMSQTDYIDSSALGMLLLLREYTGSEQGGVHIKNCRSDVKDILLVSNFDKLFEIS